MAANPICIIAEAGVNHNGSIDTAKKLIEVAARAGADYVKFQTFTAEKTVSVVAQKAAYQIKSEPNDVTTQFEMLKQLELSESAHFELAEYCRYHGIKFLSTAFDESGVDLLLKLKVDFLKIPSGEITNKPFLEYIAKQGKPVVLSTGMSYMQEVEAAVSCLIKNGLTKDMIKILHCTTEYPCPYEDVNLLAMRSMQEKLGIPIGYSDHSEGIEVAIAAAAMGACIIEKHFTLDKNMVGPDHQASIEPNELMQMIRSIRAIEKALGSAEKKPASSEIKNIVIARKSIHLRRALPKQHLLQLSDLEMKRPGDGISPMDINLVLGKRLKNDFSAEYKLLFQDIE